MTPVRASEGRTRTVAVVGPDGRPKRVASHAELLNALIAREGYERASVRGDRPTIVRCCDCRRPVLVRPVGAVPSRCRWGEGCRVAAYHKGARYTCPDCGGPRSRKAERCKACAPAAVGPDAKARRSAWAREHGDVCAEHARRGQAARTPEQRSEAARLANATRAARRSAA